MSDELVIGVRAWQKPIRPRKPGSANQPGMRRRKRRHRWFFVFDCETTADAAQKLRVGCFRIIRDAELVQEGLFYEHLTRDELELLREYADEHQLPLLGIEDFREWFFHYGYRLRATIVGHNLTFDLPAIAVAHTPGRKRFAGGFSHIIWRTKDGTRENTFRPRLRIKVLNNRAAIIDFASVNRDERDGKRTEPPWSGRFLDTKTLGGALTAESLSLDCAAEIFKTEHRKLGEIEHGKPLTSRYIKYLRRDVLVTQEVLFAELEEFARHPIDLDPCQAYSSASIGKAYLQAFGITRPLDRSALTDEQLGYWTSAFYGGRAECHIRRELIPITYLDVRSMYPTTHSLLDLQRFLLAKTIGVQDATDEVQALIDNVTIEQLFDAQTWPSLCTIVEFEPHDDVLPVRADYGIGSRSIGVNHLTGPALWYALPDVLASVVLTGRRPRVRCAFKLIADGRISGLRPLALRGRVEIDPRTDTIFKRVIEERYRIQHDISLSAPERGALDRFLKTFANATSYGIHAELNRDEPAARAFLADIYADQQFQAPIKAEEKPGRYFFMPLATLITAASRLILALLEHAITDRGGDWAFCDTDSMAVLTNYTGLETSPPGRTLNERADSLRISEVDQIVERFAALSPYDFNGSMLKIEDENYAVDSGNERKPLYALVISAKRYVLANINPDGSFHIRRMSEHGLGTYQNPKADARPQDLDR
jgi:hypothetical protein